MRDDYKQVYLESTFHPLAITPSIRADCCHCQGTSDLYLLLQGVYPGEPAGGGECVFRLFSEATDEQAD